MHPIAHSGRCPREEGRDQTPAGRLEAGPVDSRLDGRRLWPAAADGHKILESFRWRFHTVSRTSFVQGRGVCHVSIWRMAGRKGPCTARDVLCSRAVPTRGTESGRAVDERDLRFINLGHSTKCCFWFLGMSSLYPRFGAHWRLLEPALAFLRQNQMYEVGGTEGPGLFVSHDHDVRGGNKCTPHRVSALRTSLWNANLVVPHRYAAAVLTDAAVAADFWLLYGNPRRFPTCDFFGLQMARRRPLPRPMLRMCLASPDFPPYFVFGWFSGRVD